MAETKKTTLVGKVVSAKNDKTRRWRLKKWLLKE